MDPCIHAAMSSGSFRSGRTPVLRSSRWVLDCLFDGEIKCRVGSAKGSWELRRAGVAHLYPPETIYWEDYGAGGTYGSAFFIFDAGAAAGLDAVVRKQGRYCRFNDPDRLLETELKRAARAGAVDGDAGFWVAQSALCAALALLENARKGESGAYELLEGPVASTVELRPRIEAYCRVRLGDSVTLRKMAESLGMSSSSLSHRCSIECGTTPMRILSEVRVEHAKLLLMRGLKLADIADRTGFYDAYHLSHTFKGVTGLAPRAFLRRADA